MNVPSFAVFLQSAVKQQMMVAVLGMKMHLQINNIAARQRCANTSFCRRSAKAHLNIPAVKAVQRLPQIQASEPITGAAKPFAGANVPIRQQASPQRCHLIKHLRRRICQIWPQSQHQIGDCRWAAVFMISSVAFGELSRGAIAFRHGLICQRRLHNRHGIFQCQQWSMDGSPSVQ